MLIQRALQDYGQIKCSDKKRTIEVTLFSDKTQKQ